MSVSLRSDRVLTKTLAIGVHPAYTKERDDSTRDVEIYPPIVTDTGQRLPESAYGCD